MPSGKVIARRNSPWYRSRIEEVGGVVGRTRTPGARHGEDAVGEAEVDVVGVDTGELDRITRSSPWARMSVAGTHAEACVRSPWSVPC